MVKNQAKNSKTHPPKPKQVNVVNMFVCLKHIAMFHKIALLNQLESQAQALSEPEQLAKNVKQTFDPGYHRNSQKKSA